MPAILLASEFNRSDTRVPMSMPDKAPTGAPLLPLPQPEERRPRGLRPIAPCISAPIPADSTGSPLPDALSAGLRPPMAAPPTSVPKPSAAHDPLPPFPALDDDGAAHRPLSDAGKPVPSGLRPSIAPEGLPITRAPNERRSTHALKLFSLLLVIMLAAFAAFSVVLYGFFERNVEPRLGGGFTPPVREPQPRPADPLPNELKAGLASTSSRLAGTATEVAGLTAQLASANNAITRLQTQIDALRSRQSLADARLEKFDVRQTPAPAVTPASASPDNTSPDGISVMQELRLLKERNRLTLYADQSLANASSQAMANLWRAVRDPELAFVKDGAVAEIVRVQHFYGLMPGLPPSYHLPVRDLFHDDAIHSDADLKDHQIITLLLDQSRTLEVRTRAAALLAGRRDNAVGSALVEAMRHDPNLNVVKAAQTTLQENYELYAPRLFDAISMEKAWKERLAKSTPSPAPKIQVRPPKD